MQYIALLRGINVGGHHKVPMKKLREFFLSLGYTNVETYLHTGNVFFETTLKQKNLQRELSRQLAKNYHFTIPTLVKTKQEIKNIASAIPQSWQNDTQYKTDVAYLFHEIDKEHVIDDLPIIKEFIDIRYVPGALLWHVKRTHYTKSHINKIINLKEYQFMTVRNVNTVRYLAQKMQSQKK